MSNLWIMTPSSKLINVYSSQKIFLFVHYISMLEKCYIIGKSTLRTQEKCRYDDKFFLDVLVTYIRVFNGKFLGKNECWRRPDEGFSIELGPNWIEWWLLTHLKEEKSCVVEMEAKRWDNHYQALLRGFTGQIVSIEALNRIFLVKFGWMMFKHLNGENKYCFND